MQCVRKLGIKMADPRCNSSIDTSSVNLEPQSYHCRFTKTLPSSVYKGFRCIAAHANGHCVERCRLFSIGFPSATCDVRCVPHLTQAASSTAEVLYRGFHTDDDARASKF